MQNILHKVNPLGKAEKLCLEAEEKAEELYSKAETKAEELGLGAEEQVQAAQPDGFSQEHQNVQKLKRSLTTARDPIVHQGPTTCSSTCLAHSSWFALMVNGLTLLNSVQMGIEADHPELTTAWLICEHIFTAGFTFEMILKLCAFRWEYFADKANWLDGTLTLLGIMDCWILSFIFPGGAGLESFSILRVLRLLRLARVLKLVRSVKPLVLVIQGVMQAMSTTIYVFVMMMSVIYVFAIFLTEHLGRPSAELYPGYSTEEEVIDEQELMMNYNPHVCFGSMMSTMLTLFNMAILSEWPEVIRPIAIKQPIYLIIFVFFAILVCLVVLNVLIGVVCDVVVTESKKIDEEYNKAVKSQKLKILEKIEKLFAALDQDHDGVLSYTEIQEAMESNSVFAELLGNIDLPRGWSAYELLHMLDNNGDGALSYPEFTSSFFRLLDSDNTQQLCILQASINQIKNMIKKTQKGLNNRCSAIEAELSRQFHVVKPAMDRCLDDQTHPAAKNGYAENGDVYEQQAKNGHRKDGLAYENPIALFCEEPSVQVREGNEFISQKQLTEILDTAFTVMKESVQNELASITPSVQRQIEISSPQCLGTMEKCSIAVDALGTKPFSLADPATQPNQTPETRPSSLADPVDPSNDLSDSFPPPSRNLSPDCQDSMQAHHLESRQQLHSEEIVAIENATSVGGADVVNHSMHHPEATQELECGASDSEAFLDVQSNEAFLDAQSDCAPICAGASDVHAEHDKPSVFADPADYATACVGASDAHVEHHNPSVFADPTRMSEPFYPAADHPYGSWHDFVFEEDTPQLGFTVQWVQGDLPLVGSILPDGAAGTRGVLPGDGLAECNGISTLGKSRQEILQLLGTRPLLIRMLRACESPCLQGRKLASVPQS